MADTRMTLEYYVEPISETEWHLKHEPNTLVKVYDNYPDAEEHCERLNYGS